MECFPCRKQAVEDFLDEDELELARTTAVQACPAMNLFPRFLVSGPWFLVPTD